MHADRRAGTRTDVKGRMLAERRVNELVQDGLRGGRGGGGGGALRRPLTCPKFGGE